MTFQRVAIVNRGEPAVRFIRTLRDYNAERGTALRAIALYTDPDRYTPFVRLADEAVPIGPALRPGPHGMASAYTDHAHLLAALEAAQCDAVWPGWGFVAEDAAFVEALERAGITFIGPSSAAMHRLGDKIEAKRLAESAGVPMAAWHVLRGDESGAELLAAADGIGYPLVVKASAGGGGRGIRVVREPETLVAAVAAVRDEVERSFGGAGGVFFEAAVTSARHIEVQLVVGADGKGSTLGIRDCSLQRRHQKVIEEAPSPVVGGALAQQLEESAARLGEAVGYRGVGTVEFLVDPSRDFAHFLEVNTRLQVEHTVTETITGLDLVAIQIDIARGLPWEQADGPSRGHAIEVRLNAEDPERDFQPSPGAVRVFRAPAGPGIRVDSGVAEGSSIAPEFDSMVAKIIAWGKDRRQAVARLSRALRELELVVEDGATNKAFLTRLLEEPAFVDGSADTGWLDRRQREAHDHPVPGGFEALCAAAILTRRRDIEATIAAYFADVQSGIPYRFAPAGGAIDLALRGEAASLEVYAVGPDEYLVGAPGALHHARWEATGERSAVLELSGSRHALLHSEGKTGITVEVDGWAHRIELASGGKVAAPAPALVVAVHVEPGQAVEPGDRLCTLEAMKMEVPVLAREAGVVSVVSCKVNAQVSAGETLLVLESDAAATKQSGPEAPAPAPRPLERLLVDGAADPTVVDTMSEEDAQAVVSDLVEVLRARLLGFEVPDALFSQALGVLAAEAGFKQVAAPDRWRALVELVRHFPEVEQLFSGQIAVDGGGTVRAERAFYELCRRRANVVEGDHAELRPYLTPALESYGVTGLASGPTLDRALWRMARARADVKPRHRVQSGLLRALMALHEAGASFEDLRELPVQLTRTADVAKPELPAVKDNARQAKYLLFKRRAAEVAPNAELGTLLASAGEGWLDRFDDVLAAVYGAEATISTLPDAGLLDATCRAVLGHGGTRALAALVPVSLIPAAVRALSPVLAEHGRAGRFELHLFLAGGVASDATVASALDAVATLRALTRVAISWTEDGQRARHGSWVPTARVGATTTTFGVAGAGPEATAALAAGTNAGQAKGAGEASVGVPVRTDGSTASGRWTHEDRFADVHPERARRLELWRLEGFDIERLEAPEAVLAFRARARSNPRDERLVVFAELRRVPRIEDAGFGGGAEVREFDRVFGECLRAVREAQAQRSARHRYYLNRIVLHIEEVIDASPTGLSAVARRFEGPTRGLGLQKVVVQARLRVGERVSRRILAFAKRGRHRLEVHESVPSCAPIRPATDYQMRAERARRLGVIYPYEIIRSLSGTAGADPVMTPHPDMADGRFVELDLEPSGTRLVPVDRAPGENTAGVVVGLVTHATKKFPDGMTRVWIASDPTRAMGALAEPECRRIIAALDLAAARRLPVEWLPVSAGALIAMDSGTENLDWTARVLRRIIAFTEQGGEINLIVAGVNVGAQSYWNAEATMLMHTRGVLIETDDGSMVLTGKRALEVSGGVAAEDERGIGGYDRIMGPNGQAQYRARNLGDAYRILFEHYAHTYVAPGERAPRRLRTQDSPDRSVLESPYRPVADEVFERVGDIFSDATNPGRKKPFAIREVMLAAIDSDAPPLERFAGMEGAETALTWDAHIGGHPVCLIGFESRPLVRRGNVPLDGPDVWNGGTLFPNSSKKVARALRQASGNRPAVVLANLSGFDGSPESMRKLQLEYGAEIGRAVVEFDGPIVFVVIGRYHGGAYVVFSKALNERLVSIALEGTYASVIGGAPAAAVVFPREVRRRVERDPRMAALQQAISAASPVDRPRLTAELDALRQDLVLEHQGVVAREFDAIHTVDRAVAVGSLDAVVPPEALRPTIIEVLDREAAQPADPAPTSVSALPV